MRRPLRSALYRSNTELAAKESQNAGCKAFREIDRAVTGCPKIMVPEKSVIESPERTEAAAPSVVIASINVTTKVQGTQCPHQYACAIRRATAVDALATTIGPVFDCTVHKISINSLDGLGIFGLLAGRAMANVGQVVRVEMRMLPEVGCRESCRCNTRGAASCPDCFDSALHDW
jgi:hypothetical protein